MSGCNCAAAIGYGDTGNTALPQQTTATASSGIAAATAVTFLLDSPRKWTARRDKCGVRGIMLSYNLGGVAAGDVSATLSVNILDGDGTILRTQPIGNFDAVTLGTLLCGDQTAPQLECRYLPWPENSEGRPLCIGSGEYEQLVVNVVNADAVTAVTNITVTVTTEPCCECDDEDVVGERCGAGSCG